jgi:CBS domain containing-hemolysin-like protein
MTVLAFVAAVALFCLGLRLSAFFSGVETGFYRVSFLRLSIDAHAGDRVAGQILWFVQNPSYFVATTLVGNNIANYLTTWAIGLATVTLWQSQSGWVEIVGTLLMAPVVFVFGELIPKNLYYRAPLQLLRRDAPWFVFFYRMFRVVSFPLIGITKLFERFGDSDHGQLELVLGRNRLVQVLSRGHEEGLLSDVQSRLVHGLMHTAAQPVTASITPTGRVLGVADDASQQQVVQYARQHGLPNVTIKRADSDDLWYGYVRVVDATVTRKPLSSMIRTMPRIESPCSKLEALLALRNAGQAFGVVLQEETVLGIVSERELVEQLFQPPQTVSP